MKGSKKHIVFRHWLSSSQFTPESLSPLFWHDFSDSSKYSSVNTTNNTGIIVESATANTGQAISLFNATATIKPVYNREGYFFNGANGLKTGTVSTFNNLHNGGDWVMYFVYKQLTVGNTHIAALFGNSDSAANNRGIVAIFDNRSSSSSTNALSFVISNGTARLINFKANNAITQNAYNVIKLKKVGLNFSAFVNGVQVGSTTSITNSFSASDAANVFAIGCLANSASTFTYSYNKQLVIFDRQLTDAEETNMDSWAANQALQTITPEPANIYIIAGQSNASGRGLNTEIASELNGTLGAKIWYNTNSWWENVELNRNQTQETPATYHGFEMRFGYAMNALNANCYFIKFASGGTMLAQTGTEDWNVASVGERYEILKTTFLLNSLADNKFLHVLRKTPVFRGFIWAQGESDCQSTYGASYKTNFTAMFNGVVDYINNTLGYSTSKLRLYIPRVRSGITFSGFDSTQHTLVRSAQDDIGANYMTDNPSYSTKVKGTTTASTDDVTLSGDSLHFTAEGFDTIGTRLYNYFNQYVNE